MSWCAVVLVELAVAACLDCIDRAVSLRLGVVPLYRPHFLESVPVSDDFFSCTASILARYMHLLALFCLLHFCHLRLLRRRTCPVGGEGDHCVLATAVYSFQVTLSLLLFQR